MTSEDLYIKLTPRERDYLRLLVSGRTTNKAIAACMGVSTSWVQRYATHLFWKTATTNRAELILFIVRRPELEVLLRSEPRRGMPFPIFNLGPDGETQYQVYHRGFKDGWEAALGT